MFSKSPDGKESESDVPHPIDSGSDERIHRETGDRASNAGDASSGPQGGGRNRDSFRSVIGQELTITGNVTAEGPVQLDGHIEGDVHCVAITVGESGLIKGNVIAEEVEVSGRVSGNIHGKKVHLHTQARVKGDINHSALTVEQGAVFEGQSKPSNLSDSDLDRLRGAANGASGKEEHGKARDSGKESSKKSEQSRDGDDSKTIKAVT